MRPQDPRKDLSAGLISQQRDKKSDTEFDQEDLVLKTSSQVEKDMQEFFLSKDDFAMELELMQQQQELLGGGFDDPNFHISQCGDDDDDECFEYQPEGEVAYDLMAPDHRVRDSSATMLKVSPLKIPELASRENKSPA